MIMTDTSVSCTADKDVRDDRRLEVKCKMVVACGLVLESISSHVTDATAAQRTTRERVDRISLLKQLSLLSRASKRRHNICRQREPARC